MVFNSFQIIAHKVTSHSLREQQALRLTWLLQGMRPYALMIQQIWQLIHMPKYVSED